jgi:molecular chaperone GrpE
MSDAKQAIEAQPVSPGAAEAPGDGASGAGDGASGAGDGEGLAPETHLESEEVLDGAPVVAGVQEDATEVEGDLDELVKTIAQRDEYLALAQRTQADFENYRKRISRDSANVQGRGVISLAKELLPALDNLDRALEEAGSAAAGSGGDDPLLEGVRLVRFELGAALERVGIESFSPVGEPFDPAVHEAMATIEQPVDGAESGTVVEVYQPGYRLSESIIRPARVVVAA